MTEPTPDQPMIQPERFTVVTSFLDVVRQSGLILIALLLITSLILRGVFSSLDVPGRGWSALLAAVVFVAVVMLIRRAQLQRFWSRTTMTVSAEGIEVDDPVATVRLAWADVVWAGPVQSPRPVDVRRMRGVFANPLLNRGAAAVGTGAGAAAAATAVTIQDGLGGRGLETYKTDAPRLERLAREQNVGANGVDPATGQPFVVVLPAQYDPTWREGPIGAWVRGHRPDLLAAPGPGAAPNR